LVFQHVLEVHGAEVFEAALAFEWAHLIEVFGLNFDGK